MMTTMRGWTLVALMVMAAGCGDNRPQNPDASFFPPGDAGRTEVQRGRYIANTLGACTFCHTPIRPDGTRDPQRLLAGIDCFVDAVPDVPGVGCVSTRNLTNHPTGLMNKTDAEIKEAITNGTRTDGKSLVPIMPYWVYHNMTDADLDALVAYLRTVPGVDHTVAPNEQPWAGINDGTTKATAIDPATIPMPGPGVDQAAAMRGRYLSSMAGLCIDCHTTDYPFENGQPVLFPRPVDMSKAWLGGRAFPKEHLGLIDPVYPSLIFTRNLTQHADGLMGYSKDEIRAAIAEGKDKDGNAVCAGTHGSLISPYAALDEQDLDDIATYISSLPGVANAGGADTCAGPPVP